MSTIKDPDFIQPIFTHKIGRQSSKPTHAYPVIRLPLKFKSLAGRTAHVYQTQNNGKPAFLITIDEEVGNLVATNGVDKRLSALESKTDTILQFLEANNSECYSITKKKRKSKAEGEIRTRVVASTGP
jgi:hypothetical protein